MPLEKQTFLSILGPIERGINSLIEESNNPKTIALATEMKELLELIKTQDN